MKKPPTPQGRLLRFGGVRDRVAWRHTKGGHMGIVNRRNAIVGWIVLKNRKRLVKVARSAPTPPAARTGGIVAGALAGIAGIAGGLLFWRKTRGGAAE
jgi:hypothetical protein